MGNFIKSIATTCIIMLVASAASVIGKNAGTVVWQNGLGNKFEKRTQKIFTKKEEED